MKRSFFRKTDIGLRRANNEDSFLVRPDLDMCVVADGMGGAASGEIASRMFVEAAQEVFLGSRPRSEQDTYALVQEAFGLGNERIYSYASANPAHKGMGCTAELIVFHNDCYMIGHVGDSRTYLFRDGVLRQITKDHSLIQQQLDQGLITPEEMRKHALKHVVLRALGVQPSVALDLTKGTCLSDDIFLLCSDGLTDMLEDYVIQETLSGSGSIEAKGEALIDSAKAAGGYDNITVVLCQVSSS
jgi:PPM family protein phosphatase